VIRRNPKSETRNPDEIPNPKSEEAGVKISWSLGEVGDHLTTETRRHREERKRSEFLCLLNFFSVPPCLRGEMTA
jgi:hypothetical protein